MILRYLRVYSKQLIFLAVIIALVIISSRDRGIIGKVTTYAAGGLMIIAGVLFIIWIIRTPVKKDNNQIS